MRAIRIGGVVVAPTAVNDAATRGIGVLVDSLVLLDGLFAAGGLENARRAVRTSNERHALRNALARGYQEGSELARGA